MNTEETTNATALAQAILGGVGSNVDGGPDVDALGVDSPLREVPPIARPLKTAPEVYRHAALIIEERGWYQGNYEGPNGEVCMLGAVHYALAGYADPGGVRPAGYHPLVEFLCTVLPGDCSPSTYNDRAGRTAKEVTDVLRHAADMAEAWAGLYRVGE